MLEPTGPLPPEIYWRRRVLAIGVSVVVLALVIWLVVALTGGDDPDQNPEPAAAEVTTSATTTAADASADAASASTTRSGDASGSSGSRGAGGSASEDADDDDSSTTATTSAAPVPPGQCSDQSLAVRVTSDEPNYRVGSEPDFTIVITNIGTSPCERDLGAGLQQVLVYSLDGNERLWANTDCFPESTADIRSLDPGDQAAYSVKWSATTSEPGCQAPREPVGPGAYTVVGQLGGLRSVPEPFNITP
ncbi:MULTISPECIES: lipase chaperone [Rhodococcus]|uniref:Lipase chaperone n=1 Tax=Rhodococcus rhodochrous TaxID=1829 RepID=A0AA47AAF4_RHORH|nr:MULTISPECIES: lipase chaperone [Rhodococcus]MBF4477564.1 lipase chaperone [Rhodococcus rhodochrous]MCB8911006.1 lipase chaperone [Rhodococcus rhodochrous]MCD2097963.1 lipase chaperone [Rhodococcus rhodochrous]MCD2122089.1 lipase chaperone [Rhodococcus rhodochrous]MCQ4133970.1 lipase chaperone [Rhodococcus rhodochrous]